MKFRFEVFGGRETASSRLRAWKVADELEQRGHRVQVGGRQFDEMGTDVWVFQKKRDVEALKRAQACGATVVFDFDDNYLLKDVGTRHEILAVMNLADLVTVGSPRLLEEVRGLHEWGYLFENPVDVRDERIVRNPCEWRGRLVWFGNRTNLPALDTVWTDGQVTRITNGGDVEWSVETIDDELLRFDLALLPVTASEWRSAKNANRMLKCVALGLPALASATPEHLRVSEVIGLPEILLIGEGESWEDRVQVIERRYGEVQGQVLQARQKVLELWGIGPSVQGWLDKIRDVQCAPSSSVVARPRPGSADDLGGRKCDPLDVVIVVDGRTQSWVKTLRSVRQHSEVQSISVVGMGIVDEADAARQGAWCYFCSDPFRMYEILGDVLRVGDCDSVLLLRAGAELRPGFSGELGESSDGSDITLFTIQQTKREGGVVGVPRTVQEVMGQTYTPACILLPRGVFENVEVPLNRYGALVAWFGLIWGLHQSGYSMQTVEAPVVMAPSEAMSPQPVERYWELLCAAESESAKEVPKAEDEWRRLVSVWRAAVVEDCKDAYKDHAATVIPKLLIESEEAQRNPWGSMPKEAGWWDGGANGPWGARNGLSLWERVIRGGWTGMRKAVPLSLRERLFQRYKWTYYRYFPERQVGRSGPR